MPLQKKGKDGMNSMKQMDASMQQYGTMVQHQINSESELDFLFMNILSNFLKGMCLKLSIL